MVLCVESYSGKTDGEVGVKLEEMVLVNEAGGERLAIIHSRIVCLTNQL
jgi:Xaa-Pro aminopeptidase